MTIDETKYLMEALEEVKERDRIIECNTIDRVLEIIDSKRGAFRDGSFRDSSITYMQGWTRSNDAIKKAVLKLKEGEQE